jgi:GDP-4-dehydro-6-deoxy-D-mannose reductase
MAPFSGNILVTGAAGFVGRHLLTALSAAYPDVTLHTRSFDLRDAAAVERAVQDADPHVCVHLAAVSAIAEAQNNPDSAWQVNLHGTLYLARALLRHAPGCQMLFVSSSDIYGATFRSGVALDEAALLAPMNAYAETKAAADLAMGSMAARGLRVIRLRPFNHIGPGQSAAFVVASFARQIARIEAGLQDPVLQVGNLDTWRDFLDVRDVCAAYVACIDRRDVIEPGTILNIASGHPRRVGDVLRELATLAVVEMEIRVDRSRVRDTDILKACGDASRAHEILGWASKIPWPETLRDVLANWQGRVHGEAGR